MKVFDVIVSVFDEPDECCREAVVMAHDIKHAMRLVLESDWFNNLPPLDDISLSESERVVLDNKPGVKL